MTELLTLENVENDFQKLGQLERMFGNSLRVTAPDTSRYQRPSENTTFPLEYAFHLLGDIRRKTVVVLGCGEGQNTIALAGRGARVLAVDHSARNLAMVARRANANGVGSNVTLVQSDSTVIPVGDNEVDHVFCSALGEHEDAILTARQIRRLLRPGGTAVFNEYITPALVSAVSRAVGKPGRHREFWTTMRTLTRLQTVIRQFAVMRNVASRIVWEARKEA